MGLRDPAESRSHAGSKLRYFAQGWIGVWGGNDDRCSIPSQSRDHYDWNIFKRFDAYRFKSAIRRQSWRFCCDGTFGIAEGNRTGAWTTEDRHASAPFAPTNRFLRDRTTA